MVLAPLATGNSYASTSSRSSGSSKATIASKAKSAAKSKSTGKPKTASSNNPERITPLSPAGTFGKEPTVVVPDRPAPTKLETADLILGKGAEAKDGESVSVQYVGVSFKNKVVFDSSWSRGEPFQFTLGEGQVIAGWDQGVAGMRVGGRRELVIPPNLGYGASSPTPSIASNDTLIFVVDLLSVGSGDSQ
jgi:peptidylprolyl isomerase